MWRQPIPTNLEETFGTDNKTNLVYRELIYRACNKDTVLTLDGKKQVAIKRGQVLYGRNKFATYVCMDDKTCDRKLQNLEKVYNLVTMQRNRNYTIVTLVNYDELVRLDQADDQPMTNQRPTNDQPMTTSKSDKNVKSDKSEKIPYGKTEVFESEEITYEPVESSPGKKKDIKPTTTSLDLEKPKNEINILIGRFKAINPNFESLYKNKTQRKSLEDMVKKFTFEKMEKMIMKLPDIINQKYAPRITTPVQLQNKLADLLVFWKQENQTPNKIATIND